MYRKATDKDKRDGYICIQKPATASTMERPTPYSMQDATFHTAAVRKLRSALERPAKRKKTKKMQSKMDLQRCLAFTQLLP
jgi:hypothetical protein